MDILNTLNSEYFLMMTIGMLVLGVGVVPITKKEGGIDFTSSALLVLFGSGVFVFSMIGMGLSGYNIFQAIVSIGASVFVVAFTIGFIRLMEFSK